MLKTDPTPDKIARKNCSTLPVTQQIYKYIYMRSHSLFVHRTIQVCNTNWSISSRRLIQYCMSFGVSNICLRSFCSNIIVYSSHLFWKFYIFTPTISSLPSNHPFPWSGTRLFLQGGDLFLIHLPKSSIILDSATHQEVGYRPVPWKRLLGHKALAAKAVPGEQASRTSKPRSGGSIEKSILHTKKFPSWLCIMQIIEQRIHYKRHERQGLNDWRNFLRSEKRVYPSRRKRMR